MAYCTYTDVQSEFKSMTFSASTAVTDTEVTEFIVQSDAVINSYVSSRYQVPVTGSSALSFLKWISIQIVRERIIKILASKTGVVEPDQLEAEKPMWQVLLEDIRKGALQLVGATLVNTGGGVRSGNVENGITQTFDVTAQQW